jgi:hypothetical protein
MGRLREMRKLSTEAKSEIDPGISRRGKTIDRLSI